MEPNSSGGAPTQQHLRILMVDDDPVVGVAVTRMLSPLKVTFAQSAAGALARVQAGGKFDAILCDIFMPGMDGMAFCDEVAKVSRRLASRIVYMSASASAPEAAAFLARTGNTCLSKPVKREALKSAVLAAASS
jgi:CheY-like chemotaxis protein